MAFLPDGALLVTELGGRLRIIRNGVLDPKPVAGAPPAYAVRLVGLMDIALHPKFADNHFVYITYTEARSGSGSRGGAGGQARPERGAAGRVGQDRDHGVVAGALGR